MKTIPLIIHKLYNVNNKGFAIQSYQVEFKNNEWKNSMSFRYHEKPFSQI